jgi:hypothetical protein
MPTLREYKFTTLAEICDAVTDENYDTLTGDLEFWIKINKDMKKLPPKLVRESEPGVFHWIDDGKKGISKLNIEVV